MHVEKIKRKEREGWKLAKKEKLNEEKVVKLLLMHDITPRDKNYERKNKIENSRIAKLLEKIPKEMRKEADKLDTLLQSFFYSKENGKNEIFQEFFDHYKKVFRSKSGKKIIKQLESETNKETL